MHILAIDPSSTKTGLAILDMDAKLIWSGFSKPTATQDLPTWLFPTWPPATSAYCRIYSTCCDIRNLLATSEWAPIVPVVEVPSGRAGTGSNAGAKTSLMIYSAAAGAVWATCLACCEVAIPITEREWIGRKGNKNKRQRAIALMYPQYDPATDKGGDISDAIGLGLYALDRVGADLATMSKRNTHAPPEVKKWRP